MIDYYIIITFISKYLICLGCGIEYRGPNKYLGPIKNNNKKTGVSCEVDFLGFFFF